MRGDEHGEANPDEMVREGDRITCGEFYELLSIKIGLDDDICESIVERVNFQEGELKGDTLLVRMELIRATMEDESSLSFNKDDAPGGVLVANAEYAATSNDEASSCNNPWKRTVSQLSMPIAPLRGGAFSSDHGHGLAHGRAAHVTAHVTVATGSLGGPFYDRHIVYTVRVEAINDGEVSRRFSDFCWLHDMLLHKYPFRSVPSLPKKALNLMTTTSVEFLSSRRRALEEFLFLIMNHPILCGDAIVVEFVTVENFKQVRQRIHPSWREEYTQQNSASIDGEAMHVGEPSWLQYDDAGRWALKLGEAVASLGEALRSLSEGSVECGRSLTRMASILAVIRDNTQSPIAFPNERDSDGERKDLSTVASMLAVPHGELSTHLEGEEARLHLFSLLILAVQAMIRRTRSMKFSKFNILSNQIVAAQAHAEKCRARDGSTPTAELERALSNISQLQRILIYNSRRNDFADECLKQELGWVVRMVHGLEPVLDSVHKHLFSSYKALADFTSLSF